MNVYKSCLRQSFAAIMLLVFIAGCGGGGGGGSGSSNGGAGSGPVDNIVPSVTAMTPAEASTDLGTNSRITATFSEPMLAGALDPDAINTITFRLTSGDDAIPGTVSYDASNRIATFTPSSELVPLKTYIATIVTGIKDLGNNPIKTDFAWDFVTGLFENTRPTVSLTIPVNAATGVATNRRLIASFSEDMDSSTMNPQNFTVTGADLTPVTGGVTYLGRTAIFKPAQNFTPNTVYTVSITTGVKDLAGNNALQANVTSFTTGANTDSTAPLVISTNPNTASNVAIDTAISIQFNEPMNPATVTTANFTVTGPGTTPMIGTVAYDTSDNTATFTRHVHLTSPVGPHFPPVSDLVPDTTYTATLGTGARDLAGNALANKRVWSFTTAP